MFVNCIVNVKCYPNT